MNPATTMLLALAMSTDAFAAAVGKGTALGTSRWSEALRTGAIFGAIETLTPIAGWLLGSLAAGLIETWDHWIAFTVLAFLGGRMIVVALDNAEEEEAPKASRHGFWLLAMTGFATSIDAMAVGVSLAFIDVDIITVAGAIGLTTFVMVTLGVMVGRMLGRIAGRWAEAIGGVLLIGIGSTILYEHLSSG